MTKHEYKVSRIYKESSLRKNKVKRKVSDCFTVLFSENIKVALYMTLILPPANEVGGGGLYRNHPVCPSVCLSVCPE